VPDAKVFAWVNKFRKLAKAGIQRFYSKTLLDVIPAKAGIQMIEYFPRKWDDIKVLPAAQSVFL
jgi:hypothetical protein